MEHKIVVEVCVDSVESALEAQRGGADRVELCDNLMEGGTTPSCGSIEVGRRRLQVGMHVIIRPRGGDFLYSDLEFEIMKRDIEIAKSLGVDGVVIGVLHDSGDIDEPRMKALVALARPMSVTCHRAFDVTPNPFQALDTLISIGVDRVLTSGQEATAYEGAETVAKLVETAKGRIGILACGGLTPRNVRRFVAATHVREVHLTGFAPVDSPMTFRNERVFMGGTLRPSEFARSVTSAGTIRDVCDRLR